MQNEQVVLNFNNSQLLIAYKVMCQYYELHENAKFDISRYFPVKYYHFFKGILDNKYCANFSGAIDFDRVSFYENKNSSFDLFSASRKSIRNFTSELIPESTIHKAITIAINAPSVCNRQASKVYYIDDKKLIDDCLRIQDGLRGYTENIMQLLIVTCDRNYFYTVGERNQFYIDGGIFVMNLLYSLHFYEIANCPANWGKTVKDERKLEVILEIPKSEKIICFIPIGKALDNFKVTLSKRRELEEVFHKLN